MERKIIFELYVAGTEGKSGRAIGNLQKIAENFVGIDCDIRVIDILKDPESAGHAGILATPTVIRRLPPPELRVIGDMSDASKALAAFGIWTDEIEKEASHE